MLNNSDSEQCTKLNLSRVHSAPTLGPACAHTTPCHRLGLTVSQAVCCVPCRAPYRRAGRRVAHPLRHIVELPPAVSHLSHDTTQRPSHPHAMIQFIVSRHTPPATRPWHARRLPLLAGRPCRRASRSCRRPSPRPYSGLVRPCPSRIVGVATTLCLLCYDTMHCIVTKAWKWAVAYPAAIIFFFNHIIFFPHFSTY